ncbi:MAG: DUF4268 domain-containing protein, partial [Flavobacterium sp.]
MYLINKENNSLQALNKTTFTALGFKERAHLQEWIADNPEALGEKLLIIQKEFSGFSDTYERLDLLALDKDGNIVVIENKLDDSGRDVTWQAMKYAAYCSTLTKDQIEEIYQSYLASKKIETAASQLLAEFFDDIGYAELNLNKRGTQRIILIAANFRKEVTSTVLWLMNFNIQLQCFKAVPYELNDQHFLTLDQIIPTQDTQEYVISMASKTQEELRTNEEAKSRHKLRLAFWANLLQQIKGKSTLFQNSNPTKDHWITSGGANVTGLSFQLVITMTHAAVLFNFARVSKEENKLLFDVFHAQKDQIEDKFGNSLNWERADEQKSSRIAYGLSGVNYFLKEDWNGITDFLILHINKLENALKPYFPLLK